MKRGFHKGLPLPDVIERLGSTGFLIYTRTPDSLVPFIKSNPEEWKKGIHDAHIPAS